AHDSAAKLLEAGLQHGSDLRQLVEAALAEWHFGEARSVWMKRLESTQSLSRDLILALRGLGKVRDTNALPSILTIAADPLRPSHIRLEAAQSAGQIVDTGLETEAEQLTHDRRSIPMINRLCAVQFLMRHSSEPARRLLLELAVDAEPSLAVAALNRLNEIDPELVLPLAEEAMQNADPHVRAAGANAYLDRPSPERVKRLARLLDDDHPAVRKRVAEGLYRLAEKPELGEVLRAESMQVLAGDRWQGQVQATLVLGMRDHKPAADRLVQLLEVSRPDVMIHAAWGLRKLAEPHTIPVIVDKLRRQTHARHTGRVPGVDEQVAHLFEACGKLKVMEAEPLMIQYVPKDVTRTMDLSRSAAIWALGHLHAGTPSGPVGDMLIARVRDSSLKPPESPLVKQMSVVALVRMKAVQYGAALKGSIALHAQASALDLATRWAVRELTGEELPAPAPLKYPEGAWFLEPLDPMTGNQP
ncbi:MAG TPA: HEAT repeat domain-containing protein, partial [Planctomycetaceae bacterium]|nr:HEAT repeat domain-containing protein [Planctomycetaceae bacterium]